MLYKTEIAKYLCEVFSENKYVPLFCLCGEREEERESEESNCSMHMWYMPVFLSEHRVELLLGAYHSLESISRL